MTDKEKIELLLKLVELCGNGAVRPYDHSHFIYQIRKSETKSEFNVSDLDDLLKCCPPSAEVRDAKDFKPYMIAALNELARLLDLNV